METPIDQTMEATLSWKEDLENVLSLIQIKKEEVKFPKRRVGGWGLQVRWTERSIYVWRRTELQEKQGS